MGTTHRRKSNSITRKHRKTRRHGGKIQHGCSKSRKGSRKCLGHQRGGKGYPIPEFSTATLPPVPPPLIGPGWTVDTGGISNHYFKNNYPTDIQLNIKPNDMMNLSGKPWGKMWGGKHGKKHTKSKNRSLKGGSIMSSIIPSDLLNLVRYPIYNATNAYNGYMGLTPAVNPLPWVQPKMQS